MIQLNYNTSYIYYNPFYTFFNKFELKSFAKNENFIRKSAVNNIFFNKTLKLTLQNNSYLDVFGKSFGNVYAAHPLRRGKEGVRIDFAYAIAVFVFEHVDSAIVEL